VKKAKNSPPLADTRRPVLDGVQKEHMVAVLIRNEEAFLAVRDYLTPLHLEAIGRYHALLWRIALAFYEKHNVLADVEAFRVDLHAAVAAHPGTISREEAGAADEFVEYAYNVKEHGADLSKPGAHVRMAVDACRQFLEEVTASELRASIMVEGGLPADLRGELDRGRARLDVVDSLAREDLDRPFPEAWDTEAPGRLTSCGVAALDDFMGQGWMAGEILLFMAPIGVCKTLTVCHGASELICRAAREYAEALERDPKGARRPVVVLIFSEGRRREYRVRLLSHLARVPWKRLALMRAVKDLSDAARPAATAETAYEKELYWTREGYLSERRRVRLAVDQANAHLLLIDATDSEENESRLGLGGITEIAAVIRAHFRKHPDSYPIAFWLDHADALADRLVARTGDAYADPERAKRDILNRMLLHCQTRLAQPWKANVAVMHQLSGAANSRGPTARMHHTDALAAKTIAKYADFCVVAGSPDAANRVCFWCTKHRREPPSKEKVIQIDGQFNTVSDVSDRYFVDRGLRLIFDKRELDVCEANARAQTLHRAADAAYFLDGLVD
jgi:hypothetical protein